MISLKLLSAALVLALWPALTAFAEPLDGVITGQLVNKSSGGGSTAGVPVQVVIFGRKEQKPVGEKTTQTDADGHYTFTGLDRDPNFVYITVAEYQNVTYPTDQPFQLQDQTTHQADINVYETTNADQGIQLDSLNLLVLNANQGMVQFMEMGALVNTSDRTFVTPDPQDQQLAQAIKFSLPPGALGVQMQTGFNNQDVIPGIGGVQVTSPVPPGRHEFALSFQVPYTGSTADVSLQVPYQTAAFNVYVPATGISLSSNGLASAGPAQFGGQTYALYSASNISKATMVSGQLVGLGGTGLGQTQLAFISLGVVLFVLGGGVLLLATRRTGPLPAALGVETRDVEQERLELVVKLAALDERFAAGKVDAAEYERERERSKQRLLELSLVRRHASAPASQV